MEKPIKILIAEDDLDDQSFLREGFENCPDFEIIDIVSNGKLLLNTLESLSANALPDLILSDINMPLMTGTEALICIKKNELLKSIPFLIYTCSTETSIQDKCIKQGANGFLNKPSTSNYQVFINQLRDIYSSLKPTLIG